MLQVAHDIVLRFTNQGEHLRLSATSDTEFVQTLVTPICSRRCIYSFKLSQAPLGLRGRKGHQYTMSTYEEWMGTTFDQRCDLC